MAIKLNAALRKEQEKMDHDFIPAVLYGKGIDNQNLKIKRNDFEKIFKEAGESNLIDLDYGSGSVKVLVKDIQRDVVKNFIIHADFYQVNMKEKITTEIPLHFVGEAPAVKNLGGILIKDIDSLEVSCLPSDLVDHIEVDLSGLNTFDDAIYTTDVVLPEGLSLVRETNDMVASVTQPKVTAEPETTTAEGAEGEAAGGESNEEGKAEENKEGEDKKE